MPDASPRRAPRRFGDFELLEKVGQGGMSRVYKARDTRSNKIVAVKIASSQVMNDRHLSRRFDLEFAIAQPLDHPKLVKVFENGRTDKAAYLVMELVDGPSVSQYLRGRERLSESEALAIILPIGDALTYLHERQIIHRDIKPANILLTSTLQPKLADLGLVKNLDSLSRLTRSHLGLGTMQFVSPEQFDDARTADARSDIYSLAATVYLMLTGEYPFGKGTTMQVVSRKLKNEFDAPSSKVSDLSPRVDEAIGRALNADPDQRPQTIKEFFAIWRGPTASPTAPKLGVAPAPAPSPAGPAKPSSKVKKKADAKSPPEKRRAPRHAVELEARFRPINASQQWPAWILDISAFGVRLHAQRRFEPGTVVEITAKTREREVQITQLAHIRRVEPTKTNSWHLACEFVNRLEDEILNALLEDDMDHTMIR